MNWKCKLHIHKYRDYSIVKDGLIRMEEALEISNICIRCGYFNEVRYKREIKFLDKFRKRLAKLNGGFK